MRYALPIWHCLDFDTQVKLVAMLNDPHSIPPPVFTKWPAAEIDVMPMDIKDTEEARAYYDREMRKAPSRSRG